MVHAFVEFSLDDLKKDLAQAQKLMKTDQPRAMKKSLYAVSYFLKSQGIEPDLLRPLDDMAIGFLDLQIGNHPKFFKPNRGAARTMPIPDAAKMAIASAAITLAPKGLTRDDIIAKAAIKLKVSRSSIVNFRTALKAGRIKSPTAKEIYDMHVTNHTKNEDEERHAVSNALLAMLNE